MILGSHHESKIETIKESEKHIVVMSMKTSLNRPKKAEEEVWSYLHTYIVSYRNCINI